MCCDSTPDRYVEIGGSKLNEVSYQLARAYCIPCKGVYVAEPSGSKYPPFMVLYQYLTKT